MGNKYDEMFKAGNNAQLEQMKKHESSKSGYEDADIFYAARKITDYIPILLKLSLLTSKGRNIERLRKEAANISNYAHMIILKCDKEIKEKS